MKFKIVVVLLLMLLSTTIPQQIQVARAMQFALETVQVLVTDRLLQTVLQAPN